MGRYRFVMAKNQRGTATSIQTTILQLTGPRRIRSDDGTQQRRQLDGIVLLAVPGGYVRERFIFANNNITMALLPWLALLMWCLVYRQHSPTHKS